MNSDWKEGDIVSFCGDLYEIIHNYGNTGKVRKLCKDPYTIDPFFWSFEGIKCKLVHRKDNVIVDMRW